MIDYTVFSDEQLVEKLREHTDEKHGIEDYLLEKYKGLVRKISNEFYIIGGDGEDLIQEGMIGLFKAIRDYNPKRDTGFSSFAHLCIQRQIYKAMEAAGRKKHAPLNSYVSISDGEQLYGEMTVDGPEQRLIEQEFFEELYKMIWENLSKMERQVLALYREGLSYTEIAVKLGKQPKSIDNALQRIRKKVSLWNFQELGHIQSGV